MKCFDGPTLARAWLAVATAASTARSAPPALFKTLMIEGFPHGVRLYATDQFMLLVSWVPDLDDEDDGREAALDLEPEWVVIASDADGLARQLMGHVLALARRIDKDIGYEYGQITLSLDIDARPPDNPKADQTIDGLEPRFAVLSVPDVESVYLGLVDTPPPDWRPIFHAFTGEETKQITLNPEFVERLGRVRRYAEGPLVWKFGGAGRIALVDWPDSDPHIEGGVMPRRDRDEEDTG